MYVSGLDLYEVLGTHEGPALVTCCDFRKHVQLRG